MSLLRRELTKTETEAAGSLVGVMMGASGSSPVYPRRVHETQVAERKPKRIRALASDFGCPAILLRKQY
jgi:hypothetical protein